MFNIGFAELLLVLIIAYVIVGPKDLPKVARWLGRMVRYARQLIKDLKPDIILSAYASGNDEDNAIVDVLPMVPDLGVMSAVLIMERWIRLMQTKRKGEWERDRVLFEKYFR